MTLTSYTASWGFTRRLSRELRTGVGIAEAQAGATDAVSKAFAKPTGSLWYREAAEGRAADTIAAMSDLNSVFVARTLKKEA